MQDPADAPWHLYVIQTVDGTLYTGIAKDVGLRYQKHAAGGPRAAKYLRANPPQEIVFQQRIGSRSMALKVEARFKRLTHHQKRAIILAGRLDFDPQTGQVSREPHARLRG